MRFIQVLLGFFGFVAGLFLAVASAIIFYFERSNIAIVIGVVSLILLVIGRRWMRGRQKDSWRDDPASDAQKSYADDLGIKYRKNISKGALSDLISEETGE